MLILERLKDGTARGAQALVGRLRVVQVAAVVAALEATVHRVTRQSEKASQKQRAKKQKAVTVAPFVNIKTLATSPIGPAPSTMPAPTNASIAEPKRKVIESLTDLLKVPKSDDCLEGLCSNIERAKMVMANMLNNDDNPDSKNPNVRWALVDSGSGIHAIRAGTFPGLRQKRCKRIQCQTANGEMMSVEGEQTLEFVTEEGNECNITFKNCDVAFPIISVLELAKKNHKIVLEENGGFIQHRATGQTTKIVERDGVYFLKMIVPDDALQKKDFGRQGSIA